MALFIEFYVQLALEERASCVLGAHLGDVGLGVVYNIFRDLLTRGAIKLYTIQSITRTHAPFT